MRGGVVEAQNAVALHRVGDVHEQRVGNGKTRMREEGIDDPFRIETRSLRIPQPQVREPIRVDVLRRFLELSEWRDRRACFFCRRVGNLEKDRFIGLDDEGARARAAGARQRVPGVCPRYAPTSTCRRAT